MPASAFPWRNARQLSAAALLAALVLLAAGCLPRPHSGGADGEKNAEIFLLTTSDLHGRLEPFAIQTSQGTRMAGGFAGLAAQMDMIAQEQRGRVLRLNSGDSLTGPYSVHAGGNALFGALSRMGIDAATLGNHELDRGPHVLAEILKHCSFPVVVTNLDMPAGHELAEIIEPFYLFKRSGVRLLVLGLLTPELRHISSPGPDMQVLDPFCAKVRDRIRNIIRQNRPDLVIALTHLGLDDDRLLARHLPEIDVICGAHSHDLLPPGGEVSIEHADGRKTVIVQAGAGGVALGVLRIRLLPGMQPGYDWQPREIDASVAPCPRMLKFIADYRSQLPPAQVLTTTDTAIDCSAATLRSREAPVGNFIADSLREHFNTDVALYNGGGIRGDVVLPAGPLTSMDVETMLPFDNEAVVLSMSGAMLMQVLERSVSYLPGPWGGFLQISGLRMRVDPHARAQLHQRDAQRIAGVDVLGADGVYRPLDPAANYRIVTNSFLAGGGNGYDQFSAARTEPPTRAAVRDVIMLRLAAQPRHSFETDGRITIN